MPVLCWCSLAAPAQWIHYPTEGVPKLANGKPNLTAPAPKAADGKPDLSGMWETGDPGQCPKIMRSNDGECVEKSPLARQAGNIAIGRPDGLPLQPWAADLGKTRVVNLGKDDPHTHCLPNSFPRAYGLPHIQKFIQTKGLLLMLGEFNAEYRQVFTDGRPLPNDPQPTWNGYSVGKWDGETLVIDTIGFRDDIWLDMAGNPLTEAAKVTERIRRPNFGSLEVDLTINDPKAYAKPWTVKLRQRIVLDTEMMDEICAEGEQSVQHMVGK